MNVSIYLRGGNIIKIYGITPQEKSDIECGMNSLTEEHRIKVQSYILNGRAIDAVDFFETSDMEVEGYE